MTNLIEKWTKNMNWQIKKEKYKRLTNREGKESDLSCNIKVSSVQSSRSAVSNSLWPHGLQHSRPPCPSPTPRVYSNSCPLSQWCHPTMSSSVIPISSHHQSFPASSPCCPRDSQESSPIPQFKSINFSVLNFPNSPILTPIHDYWKNYSFDEMDLCWQSNVSAF